MEKLCQIPQCNKAGIVLHKDCWLCSNHFDNISKNLKEEITKQEKKFKENIEENTIQDRIICTSFFADNVELSGYQLCNYYGSGYLIWLRKDNCGLPQDYQNEIRVNTLEFSKKICELSNNNEAVIKELSILYMNSLEKLIFNIQLPKDSIYSIALETYLHNQSQISEIILDCLIKLLDTAKQVFKMRSTVKKLFFVTKTLEAETESFLSRYLVIESLDVNSLITDFYNTFSCFIEDIQQNFSQDFKNFEDSFNSRKQQCIQESQYTLNNQLSGIIATLEFEILEISCLSFNNFFETPQYNSKIKALPLLTMLTLCSQSSLGEIMVISETQMLIPIIFSTCSILIFTTEKTAQITLKLFSIFFKIAQGSTEESLLIFQNYPRCLLLYKLDDNKFKLINRSIDLGIETHLNLEHIIYIQELDKVVYVTSSKGVYTKSFSHSARAVLNILLDEDFSLNFFERLKIVSFVGVTKVMMFNIYMQVVAVIQVMASPDRVLNIGEKGFVVGGSVIRVRFVDEPYKTLQEPTKFIGYLDQEPLINMNYP